MKKSPGAALLRQHVSEINIEMILLRNNSAEGGHVAAHKARHCTCDRIANMVNRFLLILSKQRK